MRSNNIKLFSISFVMLFLEIFLIRWISTEIRIFAYISNLVLLACFLGVGLGCYFSKKNANVLITIGMLVSISLAAESQPFQNITEMLSNFPDSVIWGQILKTSSGLLVLNGTVLTIFMFLMILVAFIPLGQILGKLLDEHGNIIVGYSINVIGSLIGIWCFNIFSFFYTKPWVWFAFAIIILLFFIPRKKSDMLLACSASILILLITGMLNFPSPIIWSPYQKLIIYPNMYLDIQNGWAINVNNTGYMSLLDLSEDFVKRYPGRYDITERRYNIYELPYQFIDKKDAALILGAGAGNDAAGALRSGVKKIDAVEIDPGIYKLGRELHPEQPYEQKNVAIAIDDARAFLKKTKKNYDIITVGLLDSHTLSSNYNNMRLDHYVYTLEAFRNMKERLERDGVISVTFGVRRAWIAERIYGLLREVFGDVPYVFNVGSDNPGFGWSGTMFITSNNLEKLKNAVERKPDLKNYIAEHSITGLGRIKLTTDDWPYLYIEKPGIPRMYLLVIVAIMTVLFIVKKILFNFENSKVNMHFFFLGCAFLLLEFQNVSKAALLFGSTWIVNSYIISSILFLILMANLFVYYSKIINVKVFYSLLLISILILYLMPIDIFNAFGFWTKSILAVLILNLPIFFAGIIFIHSFKSVSSKNIALGSNLIGAATGGLLETVSFITGVKSVLLLVFALYILSLFYLNRNKIIN